jgi:hypothetical protein
VRKLNTHYESKHTEIFINFLAFCTILSLSFYRKDVLQILVSLVKHKTAKKCETGDILPMTVNIVQFDLKTRVLPGIIAVHSAVRSRISSTIEQF